MSNDLLWYKDAVFYELHVKAFQDSNGRHHPRLKQANLQRNLSPWRGAYRASA